MQSPPPSKSIGASDHASTDQSAALQRDTAGRGLLNHCAGSVGYCYSHFPPCPRRFEFSLPPTPTLLQTTRRLLTPLSFFPSHGPLALPKKALSHDHRSGYCRPFALLIRRLNEKILHCHLVLPVRIYSAEFLPKRRERIHLMYLEFCNPGGHDAVLLTTFRHVNNFATGISILGFYCFKGLYVYVMLCLFYTWEIIFSMCRNPYQIPRPPTHIPHPLLALMVSGVPPHPPARAQPSHQLVALQVEIVAGL